MHPKISWSGDRTPNPEDLDKMHHVAHDSCFIANSVTTEVTVAKVSGDKSPSFDRGSPLAQ